MEIYYKEMSKNNQYDITVNATIIDVSKKPEGIYRVRTDDAEFEAYTNAGEYYKHDNVLVQIPNGNYKNQKFILGRSLDEKVANQTFNFRLPFDNFIPLRQLNRGDNATQVKEGAYWANYPSYREEISSKYQSEEKLGTLVWEWHNTNSSTIGNTRLGIEADWQVLLGNYQPLRGTYGFIITIKGLSSATNVEAAQEIERVEYFTNRDMYGNTYAFASPYSQQKVIDISEFLNIHSIKINFYQDYMFADGDNVPISYFDRDNFGHPIVPENILFSNTNIFLGVSAEDIKDETVYLYSYDALGYQSEEEKIQDSNGDILPTGNWICNDKHDLRMVWIHYEKDGTYSVIDNLEELLKQEETSGKDTHIYWYRYNYDEIKNTTEQFFPGQEYEIVDGEYIPKIDELGYPIFSDVNNETYQEYKLLYKDLMDEKENADYQSRITKYGGTNWNFLAYLTDTFNTNIIPRGNFSREKFKVVIQHHGTKTQSKELILTNNHDVESQIAENARNDAIIIKTFKLVKEKDDDGKWINGQYEAKEDGSLNAFYVYDENNAILTNDDNERFDQHEYYVQIWIRNEETNDYELLRTIDEYGLPNGINIAWSFPTSYTMIRSSLEVTAEDAKYFKINALNDPIGFENFHNATMKFTINPILNNRYADNDVNAIIRRNGIEHHIKKDLQFGRAESLGHDFLPIIEIIYPVGGHYLCNAQNAEFQIGCTVYNKDGTPYKTPQTLTFIWKELSGGEAKFYNTGKNYDEEITDGYLIGEHHHRENGNSNLVGQMGSEMITHYEEKYKKYKNNVVYGFLKSDSTPPVFEVTVIGAADYPLTVRKGFMMCNNANYQASRDFMLPSRVEFKSDGSEPLYYSNNFEVINSNSYEENNEIKIKQNVEYPDWNINNENILHLIDSTVARSVIEKNGDLTERVDKSYKQYRLEFNTNGNPQWLDEYLDPQAYTYISYEDNGNKVSQSIAFDRNLYSSSLVNEWDGTSLTWDEENGAILSTMIAAGSKDGNNRFTGVMMGDWKAKGDESLDISGLYGYEKGEQSFGFKTDGSAFLGKSGKGRIVFDGNQSVIKSADENCYINLNPIHKNFDGTFDMNDISNQSFSENFLYCKVNKSQNSFSDAFDSIAGPDSWAREYFKDEDHDYFIVDPNYGVLTTGGVVARYGKLGNWMIGEEGLYQKTDNSYMYLGYDAKDTQSENDIRYCIYVGQNFGLSDIPNATQQVGIEPYFSVTWDGTLFARKGLIANTWTIDDTSLTYKVLSDNLPTENIYDKIYIGKPEANTGIIEGDTSSNKNRWAISAGWNSMNKISQDGIIIENGIEKSNVINFGVSLSGELYAQLGTIANWKISTNTLESVYKDANGNITSSITLDSKNNKISFFDNSTVFWGDGRVYLGQLVPEAGITEGIIYLANYAVSGTTRDTISNLLNSLDLSDTSSSGTSYDTNTQTNAGYNNVGYDQSQSASVSVQGTIQKTTVYSPSIFKIIDCSDSSDTAKTGIVIATGSTNKESPTQNRAVLFYPTGHDKTSFGNAILGTDENRWNLLGNYINCHSLSTDNLNITTDALYAGGEKVATQIWVLNQLNDVYNAIRSTGGSAAMGIKGAFGGINGLGSLLESLFNGKAFVSGMGMQRSGTTLQYKYSGWAFTVSGKSDGSGATGSLTAISGDSRWFDACSLDHTHSISGSMSDNGTLTISWNSTNFDGATGSSTIDLSAWRRKWLNEGYKAAKDKVGRSGNTVSAPSGTYDSQGTVSYTATGHASAALTGSHTQGKVTVYEDGSYDIEDCSDNHGAVVNSIWLTWNR